MPQFNSLYERVNSVTQQSFNALALDIFHYQFKENTVYREYTELLGINPTKVNHIYDIPFLPIEFFKTQEVKTGRWESQVIFESSGTTGSIPSRHLVRDQTKYIDLCIKAFEEQYGALGEYLILALLPSYLERGNSGLIAMVDAFMKRSHKDSGFFLDEHEQMKDRLELAQVHGQKTILWGVTFALLDFAEKFNISFPELIVMETGGMKGRREEMTRADVHARLKVAFGVNSIHSEYGMTELFSQGYSKGEGLFVPSKTMKVISRDVNDPLNYPFEGRYGGLNIIDLGNVDTCSFIETKDLGSVNSDGTFEVLGRIDNSDIRGCNLMVI